MPKTRVGRIQRSQERSSCVLTQCFASRHRRCHCSYFPLTDVDDGAPADRTPRHGDGLTVYPIVHDLVIAQDPDRVRSWRIAIDDDHLIVGVAEVLRAERRIVDARYRVLREDVLNLHTEHLRRNVDIRSDQTDAIAGYSRP